MTPCFADFADHVERARLAARSVVKDTSCELASSLLGLELSRLGWPAEFVRGHYLRPGEAPAPQNGHAWVEVADILLDPTRDQFGESPLTEVAAGVYATEERRPASEDLARAYLAMQWRIRVPQVRERIRAVCDEYGVDLELVKDRADQIVLAAPPTAEGAG